MMHLIDSLNTIQYPEMRNSLYTSGFNFRVIFTNLSPIKLFLLYRSVVNINYYVIHCVSRNYYMNVVYYNT